MTALFFFAATSRITNDLFSKRHRNRCIFLPLLFLCPSKPIAWRSKKEDDRLPYLKPPHLSSGTFFEGFKPLEGFVSVYTELIRIWRRRTCGKHVETDLTWIEDSHFTNLKDDLFWTVYLWLVWRRRKRKVIINERILYYFKPVFLLHPLKQTNYSNVENW